LEKVTPSKWLETIQVVKESAIHNDECNYKCLEDWTRGGGVPENKWRRS